MKGVNVNEQEYAMMTLAIHRRSLVCLAVVLVLTSACAAASSPTITDLKVVTGATQVSVGQEVAIAASISNPSGEPVTFNWSVQAGGQDKSRDIVSASPDVAAATYRPLAPGNHIITLQMLNKQKAVIGSTNITIVAAEASVAAQPTSLPSATVEAPSPTAAPTQGDPATATARPLPSATVEATSAPALPTQTSKPVVAAGATQVVSAEACPGGEVSATPQSMPFWVYGAAGKHFCPSGYMGDTGDVKITRGDTINIQYHFQGLSATCGYSPCKWAGIYWFNPGYTGSVPWASQANSGYNLSLAKVVRFRARSAAGARVEFFVGGATDPNLRYPSSLPKQSVGVVSLTSSWQDFNIALTNVSAAELTYVIDGFGWSASWDNNASVDGISFEIADIRYE
jgi:hypothetical protein